MNRSRAAFQLVKAMLRTSGACPGVGEEAAKEAHKCLDQLERLGLASWPTGAGSQGLEKILPWIALDAFPTTLLRSKIGVGKFKSTQKTWGQALKDETDWLMFLAQSGCVNHGPIVGNWPDSAHISAKSLWVLHYGEAILNGRAVEKDYYEFSPPKRDRKSVV